MHAEKSNWLVDNWQYGFCVPYCSTYRCVWCDRFDLYIFIFRSIWSFNYGEMWRGHTQVTLFALFVCLPNGGKMRSQLPPQHEPQSRTQCQSKESENWQIFIVLLGRERARIHFEILSMHFYTICANLFILLFALASNWPESAGEWSVIRSEW